MELFKLTVVLVAICLCRTSAQQVGGHGGNGEAAETELGEGAPVRQGGAGAAGGAGVHGNWRRFLAGGSAYGGEGMANLGIMLREIMGGGGAGGAQGGTGAAGGANGGAQGGAGGAGPTAAAKGTGNPKVNQFLARMFANIFGAGGEGPAGGAAGGSLGWANGEGAGAAGAAYGGEGFGGGWA